MKNGIYQEGDHLIYYKDDKPKHAGVIKIDDKIYYAGSHGRLVVGEKNVHREMCNGILERGTYTFDEKGVLVEGSYVKPKSRKSSKSNKSKRKIKKQVTSITSVVKTIKIYKKQIWKAVCLIAAVGVFLTGVRIIDELTKDREPSMEGQPTSEQRSEIEFPVIEGEVLLCTDAAKSQQDGEMSLADAVRFGSPYMPFTYEYTLGEESGIFYLSEYQDFRMSKEHILFPESNKLTIDNLKTNTQYYYKITVAGEEYYGTFKTAETTRFVKMPGVYNTRDIGGYKNLDGKIIKQGMIIRGTEIDGLVESKYYLEQDFVEIVRDTFGFKFDMDLRQSTLFTGNYASRITGTAHKFYTAPQYGQIFNAAYKESLKNIFTDLANPNNYPMYLHCTYGQDRTGTVVYLLYGILNMSEEDMLLEYQRSGYFSNGYAAKNMNVINTGLEYYEGETLQEKVVTFLTDEIGITTEQIESIRGILLEE